MSRKGNPYDNAPMESFFRLFKVEHVKKRYFATIAKLLLVSKIGLIITIL
jgi:putative transposase